MGAPRGNKNAAGPHNGSGGAKKYKSLGRTAFYKALDKRNNIKRPKKGAKKKTEYYYIYNNGVTTKHKY